MLATGGSAVSGVSGCAGVLESSAEEPGHEAWVHKWNRTLFEAIRNLPQAPVAVARQAACLNVAIFDTVNAIAAIRGKDHFEPYLADHEVPPADTSLSAALGTAAHWVLVDLFPVFSNTFDDRLAETLEHAREFDGDIEAGERFGRTVADRLIVHRAGDGHADPEDPRYQGCEEPEETPGCWRGPALDGIWSPSHYAFVDPWVVDAPDGMEFGSPPALESDNYAQAWHEVYKYDHGEGLAEEDEAVARYWFGGGGSTRPPGRWVRITTIASEKEGLSLLDTARLLARVSLGLADAGVCVWKSKHTHGFWRPTPAIHDGDADGNPETFADPDWRAIKIGGGPEYPSGLATFGSAASTILSETLGDDVDFQMTSVGPPEQTRSYSSFSEAYEESWESRIRLGVHFRFSLEDSIPVGEAIAEEVLSEQLGPEAAH